MVSLLCHCFEIPSASYYFFMILTGGSKRELAAFYVKACSSFFLKFHIILLLKLIFVYAVREYSISTSFLKNTHIISKWLLLIYLFTDSLGGFPFPKFLQHLLFLSFG